MKTRYCGILIFLCFLLGGVSLRAASTHRDSTDSPVQFVSIVPCRLVDTRNSNGEFGGPPLQGDSTRNFIIPDNTTCNIPSAATAYSLNVTVVPHGYLGYLTVWPTGQMQPNVSTLNSYDGRIKANAAIVPAGDQGAISFFVTDTTDLVLDIDGYFAPVGNSTLAFYPLPPCRVGDTRNPNGDLGGPYLSGGVPRAFPILEATSCGIPNSAQAYSLNLTAVPHGRLGYLTVWPTGQTQPDVSTLNSYGGQVAANAAIVPAGTGGQISTFASDDTDLVIDINGYFGAPGQGGLSLYAVAPCRVLDTRSVGNGQPFSGELIVDVLNSVCAPPSQSQAYVLNATVVPVGTLGYLTLWPDGAGLPLVSTLNSWDGAVTSNMAIVPTMNGKIDAFATDPTQLILDISAYFAPVFSGPPPAISDFNPKSASVGTVINVTGNNFSPNPQVTLNQQGGGLISAPVSSYTSTSIAFVVPAGAATGPITVTVNGQKATSNDSLTIVPESDFMLSVDPNSATLIQGQQVSYSVSLSSSNGFDQLASLSISGLPSGVTSAFAPSQITAGGISILTLTAPDNQTLGTSTLTITASATIGGQQVQHSANAKVQVVGVTTTFLGRTVVDDAMRTPIAGVTVTLLGVDGSGNTTGCSGQTVSDKAGNFSLSNLASNCTGPQLIGYDGSTATYPTGKYAGVNLVYTLIANQVTQSPVLIHLPRIDNAPTVEVQQNASYDQTFTFSAIPGLVVTVYAGTTFTLDDGSKPNPFPLIAMDVPVDRLPDVMPPTGMVMPFIVAFQPANATASQPVAVDFPNMINTPPGVDMTLTTLDPTRGFMVPYGTGTVSADGMRIVADADPGRPGHRYGLIHFDWHGPMPPPPPAINPSPDSPCATCPPSSGSPASQDTAPSPPEEGNPIDLGSGVLTYRSTDLTLRGGRGSLSVRRVFRSLSSNPGPFGIGTGHNYGYVLNTFAYLQGQGVIYLVMPDGNQFPFNIQSDGTFINTVVPAFRGAVLSVNAGNGLFTLKWSEGTVYQFQTSSQGGREAFLTSITDPNGNTTTLTLNSSQPLQITQITDPVGRSLNLSYDSASRITSITDPAGRTVQYSYNGQGTLASYTDAAGQVTKYSYDSQNNLLSITDPRGVVTEQNTYDVNGRVIKQVEADGGTYQFAYTLSNDQVPTSPVLLTVVTDPVGNQASYRFNPQQFLTDVVDATGQHRALTRDPNHNNLVSAYTGNGQCRTCGVPEVGDVSYTFDNIGNLLTQTDALGNTTSFTYDSRFNKVGSITDPLLHVFTLTYDSAGNRLSTSDPNGRTTSYAYNSFGELTQVADPLGNKTTYSYDAFGNLTSVTDPLGNTTSFVYDSLSRAVQIIDALGRQTTTAYDALDRISSQTNAQSKSTHFTYDQVSNLLALTDPKGNQTMFTYDGLNRLLTRTDPLGHSDTRAYDAKGNLTKFVDRRGQTAQFTYDSLNRLIGESYSDGSTVKQAYDANGRLVSATDSVGGAFTFAYSAAGYLLDFSTPVGTVKYSYDAASRVISRQVVGQSVLAYAYDPAGNLLSATLPQASASFTYDPGNRLQTITRENGVSSSYIYDGDSRMVNITHSGGQGIDIPISYSYDAVSNRTMQSTTVAQPLVTQPVTNSYDNANRLLTSGPTSYAYDANGNLLSANGTSGSTTYTWDSRNRLVSIAAPGQTVAFTYDFLDNLISLSNTGLLNLKQNVVLDALTNVAYIGQSSGDNLSVLTGFENDRHLAVIHSGGQVEYGLEDVVNSTISTVDQTGKIASSFFYEPFGQTTATSSYPFQFTGRTPVATGLYYYRARYYDPQIGRFISEDPTRSGINFYAYAGNDPTKYVDPFGLANCVYSVSAHTLICQPNADPGEPAIYGPNGAGSVQLGPGGLWSGVGPCANDVGCVNNHDLGPIVPGHYSMNQDDRPGHGGFWRLEPNPKIPGWKCLLGLARCGFELHPGSISLGCITADKNNSSTMQQYNNVNNLLNLENGSNHLTVVP